MDHRSDWGITLVQTSSDVQVHRSKFPPGPGQPDQLHLTEISPVSLQPEIAYSTLKSQTTLSEKPTDLSGSGSDNLAVQTTGICSRMLCLKRGKVSGERLARGLKCCRWSMIELRCLESGYSPMESKGLLENCKHRPSMCQRPPSWTDKDSSTEIQMPPTKQDIHPVDTSHVIEASHVSDASHVVVMNLPHETNPESCLTQPKYTPIQPTKSTSSISTSSSSTSLSSSSSSSNRKSDEESDTAVSAYVDGHQGPATAAGDSCSIEMAEDGGSGDANEIKSFLPQMVFSCTAFWFCGFIFGLVAFVLAGRLYTVILF